MTYEILDYKNAKNGSIFCGPQSQRAQILPDHDIYFISGDGGAPFQTLAGYGVGPALMFAKFRHFGHRKI